MASWTSEDDNLLSDTVMNYLRRGASIMDAILTVSKSLGRPIEAVNGRWYEHLQPKLKDVLDSIRDSVKRVNDYVGPWSTRENERFINRMVELQVNDIGVKEALLECSKQLGRSISGCTSQWYNYIIPRNRLTISNMIAEGKEKMAQTAKSGIVRNWPQEQENIALSIILNTIKAGGTIKSAFEKIAARFNKSAKMVSNYWYEFMFHENTEAITEARGTTHPLANSVYNDETRFKLYTLISDSIANGTGITQSIKDAAVAFNRPTNEIHNIWYNHLRNNAAMKEQYESSKGKATVVEDETAHTPFQFAEVEDQIILGAVLKAIKNGISVVQAFKEAATLIAHNFDEIEKRWRKTLQYKYANEIQEARNGKPQGETPLVSAQPAVPVIEKPVVETVEAKPVVGFDIAKMNDFVTMVNNLLVENQELKTKLIEANDKLAKYEELEVQNKQLVDAMERAKQFLNMDIASIAKAN